MIIIVFLIFAPKNFVINKKDLVPDIKIVKDILGIAIPTTSSRIIGNIGYFFEPIILTLTLTKIGYSNQYVLNEIDVRKLIVLVNELKLKYSDIYVGSISRGLYKVRVGIYFIV